MIRTSAKELKPTKRCLENVLPLLLAGFLALATFLPAELVNDQIQASTASGSLSQRIEIEARQANEPLWLAYEVAMVASEDEVCCGPGRRGTSCGLEQKGLNMSSRQRSDSGDQNLLVLLRLDKGRIDRVRVFSESCRVRADGSRVHWMQGIGTEESVSTLRELVYANSRVGAEALTALALHGSSEVNHVLEEIATSDLPTNLQGEAVFWLGEIRGEAGLHALERVLETRPAPKLRGEIAFALSENSAPTALDTLIDMAQSDPSSKVRGEAIFWLAQRGGERAEETVLRAVTTDPESEVRDEAVFALSELPDGAGIDRLIQVVRSQEIDRSTRREAIFWLGQSDDPRAMEFFEQALQR